MVQADFGGDIKLKRVSANAVAPKMLKAKSVVDENVSEILIGQAMDVLFKEIGRSIKCLQIIGGLDYELIHRKINQEGSNMSSYIEDY
jgi:hypothetical protein